MKYYGCVKKKKEKEDQNVNEERKKERERQTATHGSSNRGKKKRKQFHSWVSFIFTPPSPPTFSLFRIRGLSAFYSSLLAPRHEWCARAISRQIRPTCVSKRPISPPTVRTHTWEIVHRKCKRVVEKFGQHPLILARRGHHPVTPVRVCPCCKVAFHFHRTVLFPNSNGTTGREKGRGE